jgi:uncharacterized lipoprotein YmbA
MRRGIVLVILVAAGCASSPPPALEYLLSAQPAPAAGQRSYESVDVALGQLGVAAYLDRDGIVVETADGRLQSARGHVWAEPLSQSLRRVLQSGIEHASATAVAVRPLPGAQTVIDVDVERLHGTEAGRVLLMASWNVRDATGAVLGQHRLVTTRLTPADGYATLVRTHEALLAELAAAIADSITP